MTARTHDLDPESPEKAKRRNFNAAYMRTGAVRRGLLSRETVGEYKGRCRRAWPHLSPFPRTPNAMSESPTSNFSSQHPPYLDELLVTHLRRLLQDHDPAELAALQEHLEWIELPAGQTLMRQGEPGDAMYLLLIGRLRTTITDEKGQSRVIRDISRGEVVGELSLYTQEPRSATLVAVRDSVLVKLGKARFEQLLAASPHVSIALTRQIIARLKTEGRGTPPDRPVTMVLAPITPGVAVATLAKQLAQAMGAHGRVALISQRSLEDQLGEPGIAERAQTDEVARRRVSMMFDEAEAAHDFVLLLANERPDAWSALCIRHGDEVLLLADAKAQPHISALEESLLTQTSATGNTLEALQVLVLLHPPGVGTPKGTAAWLSRRPVADHVHVRLDQARDVARLARLQCRQGVGLVMAGGGARGFSHLGVVRALQECGVEIDVVGGTSIGSVMALVVATDQPLQRACDTARAAFRLNPTADFTILPLISLIKGERLRSVLTKSVGELMHDGADLEDLWKRFYCVASNYSRACEEVLERGPAVEAILASTAIPGALPPVVRDGELLCDGGTLNNFPLDVMWRMRGVGHVIGVELSSSKPRKLALERIPGPWTLLRDRLRTRAARRFKLPSLANYLVNVTTLYSTSREAQMRGMADLHFHPRMERVGLLEWNRFDEVVEMGYRHAQEVLQAQPDHPVLQSARATKVPQDT